MFCIPKILKNESNSQLKNLNYQRQLCCFVSQRYWKMKAIHNKRNWVKKWAYVVLYPKDTEKWKQFTTNVRMMYKCLRLFCIPKILKNESNSQRHSLVCIAHFVVLYPKDTEKWKQFTTLINLLYYVTMLFCIPKILKNESNSQLKITRMIRFFCCFVSQRYWKMKAIHNLS